MTNEELVVAVQAGDTSKLLDLWAGVRPLAVQLSRPWLAALGDAAGVTKEDFQQSAFIACLLAAESFQPGRGAFTTWLGFYLKKEFRSVTGTGTKREGQDPARHAASLAEPIGYSSEGEPFKIEDIVADELAGLPFDKVGDIDQRCAVWAILADQLTSEQQAAIYKSIYQELPLTKEEHKHYTKALRTLRHPRVRKQLMKCY